MKAILCRFDNPFRMHPPIPGDTSCGQALVSLIAAEVPGYTSEDFEQDFITTSLYPFQTGPGDYNSRRDRDAFHALVYFAEVVGATDVVLIGYKVRNAFAAYYDGHQLEPCEPEVQPAPYLRRFWYMPDPSGRNFKVWGETDIGKMLADLRLRKMIPRRKR